MSIIFGIFYRDGRPISDELDKMYSGMKHFPHEKHALVAKGSCGFGHMLTYNTPEAVKESMPRWIDETRLLFVAEGRIDNRDELFEALGIPTGERAGMPDGDLILKAYLKWGEKCVDRLLGKWSLAAFHMDDQKLFIARDKWDYTAIDYYVDDKAFAFATSSKGLFPLPFIKKEIDELMIARLIVVWLDDFDKTYFRGIQRLLPSRALLISRENIQLHRYWDPTDIGVRKGPKLEDYVEDLFDNLNKAVECRLRSYRPVAATLSGGMDSSTVCILAAEHLAKMGRRLRTFSHIPQFAVPNTISKSSFGDERPFVEEIVADSENIDATFLDSTGISPLRGIEEAIRMYGEPFHAAGNAYWVTDIFKTASRENYGTILMGEFGNATISCKGIEDALSPGEIFKRYGIKGIVKKRIFKPLLYGNTNIGRIYKRMVFGKRPWREISFCTEAFERSLHLTERIRKSDFDPTFRHYFANVKSYQLMIFNLNVLRLAYGAYCGCETGLEMRDPTGDPRVIESALSIPNEMFFGKMDKWILRTMMKGKLPDSVRLNKKKGRQSSDLPSRLYAHREELDRALDEMDDSGFGRIADMKRIRFEWDRIKLDCNNYPTETAFHILRPVAAYCMYKKFSEC